MSADELRKAAETLRERAREASTGDGPTLSHEWFYDLTWMSKRYEVAARDEGTVIASNLDRWTATYIATMHPGVGLALAAWLDDEARELSMQHARVDRDYGTSGADFYREAPDGALALARLINGGAS